MDGGVICSGAGSGGVVQVGGVGGDIWVPGVGRFVRRKDNSELDAVDVDGRECPGTVCAAEAIDEKVAGVGCVVDEGGVAGVNDGWRFESWPKRWSVGGDVALCNYWWKMDRKRGRLGR